MSYGASTQSNWVDTLSAASSGDGPPVNLPPHSFIGPTPCSSGAAPSAPWHSPRSPEFRHPQIACGGHLCVQSPELHETLGQLLIEGVLLVVGRQVEVIERF